MPDGDKLQLRISTEDKLVLPKALCDRHGWADGTVLELEEGPEGIILRAPRTKRVFAPTRLEDVAGMLKPFYSGPPKTIEGMNAAVTEEVLARHARGRY